MKLIIQGGALSTVDAEKIANMVQAASYTSIGNNVVRFDDVVKDVAAVQKMANACKVDFAFMDDTKSLSDYKLVAMDMDCTFIQIECIDEIADLCGLKEQVAAITHASMNGELDFNESLKRRVALLAGLDASALQQVYDNKLKVSSGAELMLEKLKKSGIKTLLVSGGFTFFTEKLKEKYQLDYTRANTLEIVDGKLTGKVLGEIVNADVKADTLTSYCEKLGIAPSETIAMGDGANDLKMMAVAGLSIAFHAKEKVKQQASIAFDYVGLDGLIHLFD